MSEEKIETPEKTEKTPDELAAYVNTLLCSHDIEQRQLGVELMNSDRLTYAHKASFVKNYIKTFVDKEDKKEDPEIVKAVLMMNNRLPDEFLLTSLD